MGTRMSKVLLWCSDVVGKKMAGPAIRYWEFATALSKNHEVILFAPNGNEHFSTPFKIAKNSFFALSRALKGATAIILQEVHPIIALLAKSKGVRIILDAYDPVVLENLEIYKERSLFQRNYQYQCISTAQLFSFRMADFILCANEKQRDLWLGLLMGQRLMTPKIYAEDNSLRTMIDVVPFGLSSHRPKASNFSMREKYGLKKEDKILLWGGGIWNWFDPLTLIEALHEVLKVRKDVHLVFMGVKHPNPIVPEMRMANMALELSKSLDLFNKHVFFNFDWTPYEERQGFLLDADIGVSAHLNHLETKFSFRTRILDYIWAELPIISSEGDFFAEMIQKRDLGTVVPCQNKIALKDAILELLDSDRIAAIKKRLALLHETMCWENIIQPIEKALSRFSTSSESSFSFAEKRDIFSTLMKIRGPEKVFKKVLSLIRN
jgi:glycosyltransferase involved in cell wall biosynthesis